MLFNNRMRTLILSGWLCAVLSLCAWADNADTVWFAPDGESPDLLDLFRQPELWTQARSRINVFKLGPMRLGAHANVKRNSFEGAEGCRCFQEATCVGHQIR